MTGYREWTANWIWDSNASQADTWMCFRKTFACGDVKSPAAAYISVDSKYRLWINGKTVVIDGGLCRGPKENAGYYDTVDLSGYLVSGLNTVAALVWYWGNGGRNNVDSGHGGFLFDLEVNGNHLASDGTWKVKRHPAYCKTDPPYPSYLYGGHNIGFDARADIPDFYKQGFNDEAWENSAVLGSPPAMPWGELFERPIPLTKDFGVLNYTEVICSENAEDKTITASLPHAAHINPVFSVNAKREGLKIDIRTDRYLVNGGPGDSKKYNSHRTEYITKKGVQQFESPDWLFGEKVIYTFQSGIDVIDVQYRETGYNTEFAEDFECNDELFNTLYQKCRRTLYVCMRDNYMDCPDRERGQWIGDVSLQIPQTFYALGRTSDLLTKKAISDFILWSQDDVLRGNVPGNHSGELPSQSLNAISEFGMIMSYYIHSGDPSVLYFCYDSIIKYLKLWETDKNGRLLPREGSWRWFDHGQNVDDTVLEYAWYYSALNSAKRIADIIGTDKDNDFLSERITKISNSFEQFWDGNAYRSYDVYDDRANAMSVLSGLASRDKWDKVSDVLTNVRFSSPYMEAYVLEALFVMGYGDIALKRMRERYENLVTNENSTLWEDFNVLGTKNHAWTGGPLTILAKYVAGISPAAPGYSSFEVMPKMFDLIRIKIAVPTVKGEIRVEIRKSPESFALTLSAPLNTRAVVGIPKNVFDSRTVSRIYCNNSCIWENGEWADSLPSVVKSDDNENFIKFEAGSGVWEFSAKP